MPPPKVLTLETNSLELSWPTVLDGGERIIEYEVELSTIHRMQVLMVLGSYDACTHGLCRYGLWSSGIYSYDCRQSTAGRYGSR